MDKFQWISDHELLAINSLITRFLLFSFEFRSWFLTSSGRNLSMERSSSTVDYGNTYGLSVDFLRSLGITTPIHTKLFVANVCWNVSLLCLFYLFEKSILFYRIHSRMISPCLFPIVGLHSGRKETARSISLGRPWRSCRNSPRQGRQFEGFWLGRVQPPNRGRTSHQYVRQSDCKFNL